MPKKAKRLDIYFRFNTKFVIAKSKRLSCNITIHKFQYKICYSKIGKNAYASNPMWCFNTKFVIAKSAYPVMVIIHFRSFNTKFVIAKW